MTKNTQTALDTSAANIAFHLVPAIRDNKKSATKHEQTFFEEIRQTISCKENRPYVQSDCRGIKLENVCKSKEQLDYLANKTIEELERYGIVRD